ncbi:MAG: hypothetical protein N3H31_06280 [Candidatus Nezhaarchaeota archaeon]|nr:hypothetical protein [Candidatus Nezhaarchaeota archaeon]
MDVKKIVVVTADWEKLSGLVKKACEEAAKELGVEVEELKEDWDYLVQHGAKDEYGGIDLPQVFLEFKDGAVKHVLTRMPLNERGKPDVEGAVRVIVGAGRVEAHSS